MFVFFVRVRGPRGLTRTANVLPYTALCRSNVQDTVSLSALYARLEAEGHEVDAPGALLGNSPEREAVILKWLDDAAEALVRPLIAVNCLINPAAILIGGRLPGKLVDGLVERLNARMTGVKLPGVAPVRRRSEEHTSELQSIMRHTYD